MIKNVAVLICQNGRDEKKKKKGIIPTVAEMKGEKKVVEKEQKQIQHN